MITEYGIHPAHDAAIAAHKLKDAIQRMADDEPAVDRVGLGTVADMAALVADALDRHWSITRRAADD